ncbi:AT-hook motif nuclear-localized protein 1 [Lactuca sativa]|uniref:AT-hook motif nuclear-localized protein n=1 Tax=Lactuca sativa TaxID=4236 RepID=A0A9R1X2D0_LACSA|nr:AT-hook motif nuclear-localized protein 1 [Lactuca sativa]KAJ0195574.1 hypothetical protein LSAT_V11C700345840 [Lactuca sativa]
MDSRENMIPAVETISPEAPSSYQLAPRNDNSNLLITPPGFSPVSGGIPSSLVKKKRGRPRKYGPDGVVAGGGGTLSPLPISASAPPDSGGGYSDVKFGEGEGSGGGSFVVEKKKKVKMNSSEGKLKNSYGSMDLGDRISSGGSFTPHMVTVNPGEDVTSKIISFTKDGPRSICILSAVGVISHVTLRHADSSSSGGTVTYEGRFEILSLSGSFTSGEIEGQESKMSIALCSPDGRVVGGQLGGLLTAAGPVQVVVASFLPNIGSPIDPKPKKQKTIVAPTQPHAINMEQEKKSNEIEHAHEAGGNTNSTPTPTRNFQFENHTTGASVHDWRRAATDMNVSLSED